MIYRSGSQHQRNGHTFAHLPATGRRATTLNDLVSIAYEEHSLDSGKMDDIEVNETLREWLTAHTEV